MTDARDEALAKSGYPKMDAEIKARWVKALRSGEYVQTRRALWMVACNQGVPAGNCCLGVLCRVSGLESEDRGDRRGFIYEGKIAIGYLISDFAQSINLSKNAQDFLVQANDAGATFPEIADWIEQNL